MLVPMRAALALLCILLVLPAWGEETTVYKRARPDGTIEFSDTPFPESKAIQVPPVPTYKAPPVVRSEARKGETPAAQPAYKQITVTSPAEESTLFFDEQGMVVSVKVDPGLKPGDRVVIYLDGQRAASGPASTFTLKDVFRGTHTVRAAVEDAKRTELLRSGTVTFYMVQHTVH